MQYVTEDVYRDDRIRYTFMKKEYKEDSKKMADLRRAMNAKRATRQYMREAKERAFTMARQRGTGVGYLPPELSSNQIGVTVKIFRSKRSQTNWFINRDIWSHNDMVNYLERIVFSKIY